MKNTTSHVRIFAVQYQNITTFAIHPHSNISTAIKSKDLTFYSSAFHTLYEKVFNLHSCQ